MSKRIGILKDYDGTCGESSLIVLELKELPVWEQEGEKL